MLKSCCFYCRCCLWYSSWFYCWHFTIVVVAVAAAVITVSAAAAPIFTTFAAFAAAAVVSTANNVTVGAVSVAALIPNTEFLQIRLDFSSFEMDPGSPSPSPCDRDRMEIIPVGGGGTGGGGRVGPLCGKNTGQHMYLSVGGDGGGFLGSGEVYFG